MIDPDPRLAFEAFARENVRPFADGWDRTETLPGSAIEALASAGHLGSLVPERFGGKGMDLLTFGWLNESIGAACSSLRSLMTVHGMVVAAISRWGSPEARQAWLPRLATGNAIGAFALSEAGAGSDASAVQLAAVPRTGGYSLTGQKSWTSFGQIADVFLVLAREEGAPSAFLVPRATPGITLEPVTGLLGLRASMMANVTFADVQVREEWRIGRRGAGLVVALSSLAIGRLSVAWGAVGLAQASLDATVRHTAAREQFGSALRANQLVQGMVADVAIAIAAARLLCVEASTALQMRRADAELAVWSAKYAASKSATSAAANAVQLHGAIGCVESHEVGRLYRDAKILEIVEGASEIAQTVIASETYRLSAGRA